jgi:hypothetical protein
MKKNTPPPLPTYFSLDQPARRDQAKESRTAIVTLLLIACALAIGAGLTGTVAARADTRLNAFRAARPCPAAQVAPKGADCLAEVTATLRNQYFGKEKPYYPHVVLAGIAASPVDVTLPDTDGLFGNVIPGGSLRVTLWEGKVMRVSGGGQSASTLDVPVPTNVSVPLVGALFTGTYALLAMYFAGLTLLARTIAARFGSRPRLVDYPRHFAWVLLVVSAAAFGVAAVGGARGPGEMAAVFAVSALASAIGIAVVRPGQPPRPHRHPSVNLPSATTPYQ